MDRISARTEHRRYQITNGLLLGMLGAYLLIVLNQERVMGRGEFFPFASWSLFSKVPNVVHDYSLRLTRVGDRQFNPGILYENAGAFFPSARENASRSAIHDLGSAIEHNDVREIARIRAYLEALHLNGQGPVNYEIVVRQWETMERWRTGQFRQVTVLASFHSD